MYKEQDHSTYDVSGQEYKKQYNYEVLKKKRIEERTAMREDIVQRVIKKMIKRNQLKRRQGERARKVLEQKVNAFCCTGDQADLKLTDEQVRTMTQLVEGDDVVNRFI